MLRLSKTFSSFKLSYYSTAILIVMVQSTKDGFTGGRRDLLILPNTRPLYVVFSCLQVIGALCKLLFMESAKAVHWVWSRLTVCI